MKKLAGLMLVAALASVAPVYAEGASAKPLSITQFSELTQNRGVGARQLDRLYSEYRNGRYAVTTLDAANGR